MRSAGVQREAADEPCHGHPGADLHQGETFTTPAPLPQLRKPTPTLAPAPVLTSGGATPALLRDSPTADVRHLLYGDGGVRSGGVLAMGRRQPGVCGVDHRGHRQLLGD